MQHAHDEYPSKFGLKLVSFVAADKRTVCRL